VDKVIESVKIFNIKPFVQDKTMNTEFNTTRLGYFLRRQLYMNISSMWIAIAGIMGLLLVISGLVAYFKPLAVYNLIPLYTVTFYLGGYIFTSKIFHEMHVPQKSYAFLTLPVSASEKLLGAWLITSPIYLITTLAAALILFFLSTSIAGMPFKLSGMVSEDSIRIIGSFLVSQIFYFVGAVAFKGNNFFKTLLALFIVVMLISAYGAGLGYLLFGGNDFRVQPDSELQKPAEFIFREVIPFLYWYVLGPFLLLVAYFKLKERQV
jgi:hypothetical protein